MKSSLGADRVSAERSVYVDLHTVQLRDGALLRVADAIARLPWTPMLCPTMPHQYVVSGWREILPTDLAAILAMIRDSPDTRLAYWRGYQSPTRYWHGPDGFRYWTSPAFNPAEFVINRTDEVDDTRPVDEGGKPFGDWEGCPWERLPARSRLVGTGGPADFTAGPECQSGDAAVVSSARASR